MKSIQFALLAVGIMGFGLACDAEVEDLGNYDAELEDFTQDDGVDRAAALSCAAIKKERKVCVGQDICAFTAHGQTTYRRAPAGGCNANETTIPTTTAEMACDAAAAITPEPSCPAHCAGPVTSDSGDAMCCTATKHCIDAPPPADVEPVEVEDGGQDADADADAEPVDG